ncbi:MAG: LptF/LptG family permease, partial [Verrucomicrobiales bacterium]
GRSSADQEYTAAKASGLSLASMVTPVLLLAVAMSGFCGIFNLWAAPQARTDYKNLLFKRSLQNTSSLITEDRFIDEIPGMVLYVGKKDGETLKDIRIYQLQTNQIVARTSAAEGSMRLDPTGRFLHFELRDVVAEARLSDNEQVQGPDLPSGRIEWRAATFSTFEPDPIDLAALMKEERKQKISEMNFNQLLVEAQQRTGQGIDATPVLIQIHRQVSFSFACFAFTMVGIPLAIQTHRRETSLGVAIALALLLIYYSFFIMAEALENKPQLHPYLLVWLPNFLFQGLGFWLLWRANKRR